MKIQLFALLFGTYPGLHSRLIDSLMAHAHHSDIEIKLWCNQVCELTGSKIAKLGLSHVLSSENVPKYKLMRQLFADLHSDWVVWMDDDSWLTAPDWYPKTCEYIERRRQENICYIGQSWFIHLRPGQEDWIKAAKWYTGRPVELIRGKPAVNFHTGGYWWLRTDVLKKLDWPDERLSHNGGDVMLGQAVYQSHLPRHHFDYGVKVNDAQRRGRSERPAGTK